MKMSDVLHSIADMLDQKGSENESPNKAELTPVHVNQADDTESVTMIPPLQQKLEILKKSVGMDNAMDNAMDNGNDELEDIKKLTGVKAVIQHIAGEDNDIVG